MAKIVKLLRNGSPETLFTNALAEADEVEVALVVMLRKDGMIRTDWSTVPSGLTALGLVDMLHKAVLKEM